MRSLTTSSLVHAGATLDRRSWLMSRLLMAIALLSFVDLLVTLWFMKTTGMHEANPVVRGLALTHGAAAVAIFKGVTVAVALTPLYALRRRATAHVAAWVMVATLTWLTVQWARYGEVVSDQGYALAMAEIATGSDWVKLD